MCLGQKGVQAFRQPVIEKEDFWLERSGGVNANIKMAVLFSGFSERGRKSIQAERKKFRELIAVSERTLKFSKLNICFLQRKYSSILQREK